jgi:hypothetical protein
LFAADISGDWEFAGKYLGDTSYARINLKREGDKLTGNMNELKLDGALHGNELSFTTKRPNGEFFGDFKGSLQGDNSKAPLYGLMIEKFPGQQNAPFPLLLQPHTHDFEPTEFHRVFSDAIPPVLHIFPGGHSAHVDSGCRRCRQQRDSSLTRGQPRDWTILQSKVHFRATRSLLS